MQIPYDMDIPDGWQTFHDSLGLYSVRFPPGWIVTGGINEIGENHNFIKEGYIEGRDWFASIQRQYGRFSVSAHPHNLTYEQTLLLRTIVSSLKFTEPDTPVVCTLLFCSLHPDWIALQAGSPGS